MKKYYKETIGGLTILLAGAPIMALAQNVFEVKNPLGATTVTELLSKIGGYFYGLSAAIATIMILYGAFQILTAGSDSQKVTDGKNTIFYAALGLAIVFFAGGLKSLITNILGGQGGQNNEPNLEINSNDFNPNYKPHSTLPQ